jgi:hypothetical protein
MQAGLITIHKDASNTIITEYKENTKLSIIKIIYMNNCILRTISIYFNQILLNQSKTILLNFIHFIVRTNESYNPYILLTHKQICTRLIIFRFRTPEDGQ